MSRRSARAFIEKLAADETLLAEIKSADSDEAKLGIAEAAGFSFTIEEIREEQKRWQREISDQELDAVAGGIAQPPRPIKKPTAGAAPSVGATIVSFVTSSG